MNRLPVSALSSISAVRPWLLVALLAGQAQAQTPGGVAVTPTPPTPVAAPTPEPATPSGTESTSPSTSSASPPVPVTPSKSPVPARKPPVHRDAHPTWAELSHAQREALRPLADAWPTLSELHKRKWLVLSQNFAELSPPERHKLQERMSDWASLTARERAQARLHFAEVQQLPGDERRAKWEAYQALSDEQRRKLADEILLEPPRGAAVASRPVASKKLTQLPASKPDQSLQPRIDTDQIQPKTLLPHFLQGTSTR